jgi:hypothetical protein
VLAASAGPVPAGDAHADGMPMRPASVAAEGTGGLPAAAAASARNVGPSQLGSYIDSLLSAPAGADAGPDLATRRQRLSTQMGLAHVSIAPRQPEKYSKGSQTDAPAPSTSLTSPRRGGRADIVDSRVGFVPDGGHGSRAQAHTEGTSTASMGERGGLNAELGSADGEDIVPPGPATSTTDPVAVAARPEFAAFVSSAARVMERALHQSAACAIMAEYGRTAAKPRAERQPALAVTVR